ncbi:MAG: glucoamylase family protein, partial [Paracoccaceae bacterium]
MNAADFLKSINAAAPWNARRSTDVWQDKTPIRAELFGTERLEHHAESLATAQHVATGKPPRVPSLSRRVNENAKVLLDAYRVCAKAVQDGQPIAPAAEWLLDNFHLVEQQLRQISDDLPPGYYRQLPKLIEGPFAGYPRVFGLAWAYVAHTDSLLSGQVLRRYVRAYQSIQPLKIGELWAVAITLRIVLIENMRRLAVQIIEGHALRQTADKLVDDVLSARAQTDHSHLLAFQKAIAPYEDLPLSETVAAQIAKRLRGYDPAQMPLLNWLEDRLHQQGKTVEDVVTSAQLRMGASNVSMRNIVTSMRLVSDMDWSEFFEDVSVIDARLGAQTTFTSMDFPTRNRYRTEIEILARGSGQTEGAVADTCLRLANEAVGPHDKDPGHWLIGRGRPALETAVSFRRSPFRRLRRWMGRYALPAYLAAIVLLAAAFLTTALASAHAERAGLLAIVALSLTGIAVAVEAATAVVNTIITRSVAPHPLPSLDLAKGVPSDLRTLVAVPVLLHEPSVILHQIEQLEVHHLSSAGGALHYALLSDFSDAGAESSKDESALKDLALDAIRRLNTLYPSEDGARFFFLHRDRQWNPSEGVWMGWERKRGKLMELNRLLRGAQDTSFTVQSSPVPQDIRYVITLDADTRLLRDTVHKLIGKMAHPLNHPRFSQSANRVTDGYGIMQPRVSAALPLGADGSIYQRIFSSPGGIEPYAAATSDLYQDLFEEGSFTGKGIYDVDAFEKALADRVPENTMLSHDLFEGVFARAALASDIEVVEDFPTRYDADSSRQHRWARGDWQLLPWIFGARGKAEGGLPAVGRWKMLDNLRRSLLAPMVVLTLCLGWLMGPTIALMWTIWTILMLALPRVLPLPFGIVPTRTGVTARSHLAALGKDTLTALSHIGLVVVFLADAATVMLDAIIRTVWRLAVSRRHLLEWVTAEQASRAGAPTLVAAFRRMAPSVATALFAAALVYWFSPGSLPLALPFCILWVIAPLVATYISKPRPSVRPQHLTDEQRQALRSIARRTWRYFETFVTAEENFLPPDNFQEIPKPKIASRTSPTNIGLYLLSTVVAHDLGWIGRRSAVHRLRDTLATIERMHRFRGHLYNWYDTRDLRVLDPPYVSSVDSGNLAGHLIALSQSCREWQRADPTDQEVRPAIFDGIDLARQSLVAGPELDQLANRLATLARSIEDTTTPLESLASQLVAVRDHALAVGGANSEAAYWIAAAYRSLTDHFADRTASVEPALLDELATKAHRLAIEMDFGFLFEPDKKLLLIGFSVATNRPDTNCYDLLASEARLASLFAIAKGDVETRHWFRLGRAATPLGAGSALISWSGSMFEYLMPSLVMRAPQGSMLAETNRMVVARQEAYGAAIGMPWGISESAFNARDLEMTYQYSNFGVPGLGLKRGLSENRVVAPYATGLAAMIDPAAAARNYAALSALGAEGRYGFYEAIDFTPSRLQTDEDFAIVRSFMAHHQGMTITAIANMLQGGRLRDRFHAEPMIQASDLLLQERVPRDVATSPPRATEVAVAAAEDSENAGLRTFEAPASAVPTGHILSNGNYSVLLTPTGEGFSRWRDIAVTRWRAEATQATFGSFIFMRDTTNGLAWSAGVQPTGADAELHRAAFNEHHAAYTHHTARLTTTTEVVVSAEDDAEARRVTLTNTGRRPREVDVTSYAELVLAPLATDIAHPAFAKMFVVTDYL